MANEDEKESKLEDLYSWISGIPLSKTTKNLSRDFSDAVMMAEILKVYYPRYVDLHNYMPVSSLNLKKENWSILNRKVLSKIDMRLTKDVINQLANCHPGAAENILLTLKKRISKIPESNSTQDPSCNDKQNEFIEENGRSNADELDTKSTPCPVDQPTSSTANNERSMFVYVREKLYFLWRWLLSLLSVWNYFPYVKFQMRNHFRVSMGDGTEQSRTQKDASEEDAVPRHVCAQLKQELREIDDIICTLNHKVAYLESAMKLKDQRISNLTSQILQSTVEAEQLVKLRRNDSTVKSQSIRVNEKIKE